MGLPTNERATLDALIAAAAPDPVPARQALDLLKALGEPDAAVLGRLAYHALTGVAPGDGEPEAPAAVAPGFPPFAAEVLMRAICGPDHRRPTSQALIIVLDTVPAASWPTARQAPLAEPVVAPVETEPVVGPAVSEVEPVASEVEPEVVPDPEVEEPTPEPLAEPEPATPTPPTKSTASSRAAMNDEFRSLLTPSRTIPRFDPLSDPLTDPWVPDAEDDLVLEPLNLARISPSSAPAPIEEPVADEADAEETVVDEPVAEEPVVEEPVVEEPVATTAIELPPVTQQSVPAEPEAEVEPEVEAEAEPEAEPEEAPVEQAPRGMHDEFRNFASPGHDVPRFETLEGRAPEDDREARSDREPKRTKEPRAAKQPKPTKEPKPAKEPKAAKEAKAPRERHTVANDASADDRHQTMLLVALILVLIVLGVVYAASRSSDDTSDTDGSGTPQGASRSIVQPESASA
ncbi:hypothetical protein [Nocardioides sp. Root190]|uniref:hypothetical protein n=1 Tax=Nocardioides sp. Root190 TaxID=1736488 RepID=UPI001F22E1D0|nr:hypothetical protein [Nocardioides sp. Root190]